MSQSFPVQTAGSARGLDAGTRRSAQSSRIDPSRR